MADNRGEISMIPSDWNSGNRESADTLLSLVYRELRKIAEHYMRKERAEHTLQPTALVHEAYMRLIDISDIDWAESRSLLRGVVQRDAEYRRKRSRRPSR